MISWEAVQSVLSLTGHDARNRKLMTEHTKRVSKALRILKGDRAVQGAADGRGNLVWTSPPFRVAGTSDQDDPNLTSYD